MEIRKFGSQGLKTSQLGLGCMGMSEFYGPGDDAESIKVIHRAIERGVTFLDTSDAYGPFTNEVLVGKAIKGKRDQVLLATKFGIVRDLTDPNLRSISGTPAYVASACEASLKRLDVEVIDLYYLHRVDPATPIETTVAAMGDLVKAGKVKTLGLSEVTPATLRKAHNVHPITAVQNEYSLWSREPEDGVLATCQELGIAFVPYSPLGRGFLTGNIKKFDDLAADDWRRLAPRFMGDNFQKNLNLVTKLEAFAAKKNCTISQLALAWVVAQGDNLFPIPGTKRMKYLEENIDALNVTFSKEELKELDTIAPKNVAVGNRYMEGAMKFINA
ncbi:MAG: aldo/keto reductase [Bacteroidia bacterium]|nr:aldo/keto reductase [Bacteroidia bacterium]